MLCGKCLRSFRRQYIRFVAVAFDYRSTWFTASEKITWIVFIALLFSVNAGIRIPVGVLMNKAVTGIVR